MQVDNKDTKETDAKIKAVLTAEQKKTSNAMKEKMKKKRMNKLDAKAPNGLDKSQ